MRKRCAHRWGTSGPLPRGASEDGKCRRTASTTGSDSTQGRRRGCTQAAKLVVPRFRSMRISRAACSRNSRGRPSRGAGGLTQDWKVGTCGGRPETGVASFAPIPSPGTSGGYVVQRTTPEKPNAARPGRLRGARSGPPALRTLFEGLGPRLTLRPSHFARGRERPLSVPQGSKMRPFFAK